MINIIKYWVYKFIIWIKGKKLAMGIFILYLFSSGCAMTLPAMQSRGGSLYLFKDVPDSMVTQDNVSLRYPTKNTDLLRKVKFIQKCFDMYPENDRGLYLCLKGNR